MRHNLGRILLLPGVCLILAGIIGGSDRNEALFLWLNNSGQNFNPVIWERFWSSITILGDSLVILAMILPLALIRPAYVWHIISAALLTTVVIQALKFGLQVPRPALLLGHDTVHIIGSAIHKRSFPSGHTAGSFVAVALLISMLNLKRTTGYLLIGLACLVGVSRCMVGAHWPLDVLAGAAIGWLLGSLLMAIFSHKISKPGSVVNRVGLLFLWIMPVLLLFHHTGYPQALWMQFLVAGTSLVFSACLVVRWCGGKQKTGEV